MRYLALVSLLMSGLSMGRCGSEPASASLPDEGDEGALELEAHPPIEIVALLDTSESMTRHQMALAVSLLENVILRLSEADRFGLVVVADEATVAIEPSYGSAEAKRAWTRRVRALDADGLTNLEDGLRLARSLAARETRVVLITDGSPTWGVVVPDELASLTEGLDVWTVGVGRNNQELLSTLGRYARLTDPVDLARSLVIRDVRAPQSHEREHREH